MRSGMKIQVRQKNRWYCMFTFESGVNMSNCEEL